MKNIDYYLDQYIKDKVNYYLNNKEISNIEYIETDNFAEILEKLIILHIRTWMLEDAIQSVKTDDEIANLKRKIDICFKIKRPKLLQALNIMIDDAILKNKSLKEESVKLYKNI